MINEKELERKYEELFGKTEDKEKEEKEKEKDETQVELEFPAIPSIELPVYEKMEYTPATDEEIEQNAKEQLENYKNSALSSYDLEYNNTKNQKERDKEKAEDNREESERKVNATYDEKSKKIDYDLIKRGMVNSSTNSLLKEQNENQRKDAITAVSNEYAQVIEKLDNEIAQAENKRQEAIAQFNISYALKYSNLVSKLISERDQMVNKALEYNNKIEKQEYDDKINKEKTESKLYSEALDQYEQELDIENKQREEEESTFEYKLYKVLKKQLEGMSKQDAYNAIHNDPTYAENLSTKYYMQLVHEYGR